MIIWGKRKKIGQYTHLIYEVQENWENPNVQKKNLAIHEKFKYLSTRSTTFRCKQYTH
jgi:hypothetical protein